MHSGRLLAIKPDVHWRRDCVTARVAWRPEEEHKKDSNANEPNAKHLTPSKICSPKRPASIGTNPLPRNISGVVRCLSSSIFRPPPVRRPSAANFRRRSDTFSGASTSREQTEWPHELSGPGDHKALRAKKQRRRQHSAGPPPTPIHNDETRNYSRWYVSNPLHFASSLRDPPRSPGAWLAVTVRKKSALGFCGWAAGRPGTPEALFPTACWCQSVQPPEFPPRPTDRPTDPPLPEP